MSTGNHTADRTELGRQEREPIPGFEHLTLVRDRLHDCYAARIKPGEFAVSARGDLLVTVLGSCVAACIRDDHRGIAGMNHFMLPTMTSTAAHNSKLSAETRFGTHAMENLINELLKRGADRKRLTAKVFGGARVLNSRLDVGDRNIEFVRDYLSAESVSIVAEDLGGRSPRKVYYDTVTGWVRVRRLRLDESAEAVEQERVYRSEIAQREVGGSIELF